MWNSAKIAVPCFFHSWMASLSRAVETSSTPHFAMIFSYTTSKALMSAMVPCAQLSYQMLQLRLPPLMMSSLRQSCSQKAACSWPTLSAIAWHSCHVMPTIWSHGSKSTLRSSIAMQKNSSGFSGST